MRPGDIDILIIGGIFSMALGAKIASLFKKPKIGNYRADTLPEHCDYCQSLLSSNGKYCGRCGKNK